VLGSSKMPIVVDRVIHTLDLFISLLVRFDLPCVLGIDGNEKTHVVFGSILRHKLVRFSAHGALNYG